MTMSAASISRTQLASRSRPSQVAVRQDFRLAAKHAVRSILKHELTHSFIRLKTAGSCPLWLNEGLAQYLSGDSSRSFVPLAKKVIGEKRFPALSRLEGPFIGMEAAQAAWAYQESLLATEFLMKVYGLSDVQKLLENSGKTGSFLTGLRAALRLEYAELQREFEEYVQKQ